MTGLLLWGVAWGGSVDLVDGVAPDLDDAVAPDRFAPVSGATGLQIATVNTTTSPAYWQRGQYDGVSYSAQLNLQAWDAVGANDDWRDLCVTAPIGGASDYDVRVREVNGDLWWTRIPSGNAGVAMGLAANVKRYEYPAMQTIKSGEVVAVPTSLGFVDEIRFLTTGAKLVADGASLTYTVTLTYDDGVGGTTTAVVEVPIDDEHVTGGTRDPDYGACGGVCTFTDTNAVGDGDDVSYRMRLFDDYTSTDSAPVDNSPADPDVCDGAGVGDEVAILNPAYDATSDVVGLQLLSIQFDYPEIDETSNSAPGAHLAGPLAVSLHMDSSIYDDAFVYRDTAVTDDTTNLVLSTNGVDATWYAIDWALAVAWPDDYSDLFISYQCGQDVAGTPDFPGVFTDATPGGLRAVTVGDPSAGTLTLPTPCFGEYLLVQVEIVAAYQSPQLATFEVRFDEDGDGDGYTVDGTAPGSLGIDQCDDDDLIQTRTPVYADLDGDGDGAGAVVDQLCVSSQTPVPANRSTNNLDCNDASNQYSRTAQANRGVEGLLVLNDFNCDGFVTCYADADNDDHGPVTGTTTQVAIDGPFSLSSCSAPANAAAVNDDCKDDDNTVYPGATEAIGGGIDNDCSGATLCYVDADGDTWGSGTQSRTTTNTGLPTGTPTQGGTISCTATGFANRPGDCDDTPISGAPFNPGASETNGIGSDLDCSGTVVCFRDNDGDGDGVATTVTITVPQGTADDCDVGINEYGAGQPAVATAPNDDDCDDNDANYNTSATETAGDGQDRNCDDRVACFLDNDNDGYGDDSQLPADYVQLVLVPGDGNAISCDRTSGDGRLEQLSGGGTQAARGTASTLSDCDDTNVAINPGGTEVVANAADEDCNGFLRCYRDTDLDTYGTITPGQFTSIAVGTPGACNAPGAATRQGDCNDSAVDGASYNPAQPNTVGDLSDFDCDGLVPCYFDNDDDDHGTSVGTTTSVSAGSAGGTIASCSAFPNAAAVADDCDDGDDTIFTGAPEADAQGTDFDCSGAVTCYEDLDRDGNGSNVLASVAVTPGDTISCARPASQRSASSDDCDDNDSTIDPDVPDVTGQGKDNNCDGVVQCFADADDDTYGVSNLVSVTLASQGLSAGDTVSCTSLGHATNATDCLDSNAQVNPGSTLDELTTTPTPTDFNCDGSIPCYLDEDCDGFGDDGGVGVPARLPLAVTPGATQTCQSGNPTVPPLSQCRTKTATDCNDTRADVFPGAPETDGVGVDNNCDAIVRCFVDDDLDGYGSDVLEAVAGTTAGAVRDCANLTGYSATSDDCLDCFNLSGSSCTDSVGQVAQAAAVHPGAVETLGNGFDEDCNDEVACYPDEDDDGQGDEGVNPADTVNRVGWFPLPAVDGQGSCNSVRNDGVFASANALDCHDDPAVGGASAWRADPSYPPPPAEVAGNTLDDDCNGVVQCLRDNDSDGVAGAQGWGTATPNLTVAATTQQWNGSRQTSHAQTGTFDRVLGGVYRCAPSRNEAHTAVTYDCYDGNDSVGPFIFPGAEPVDPGDQLFYPPPNDTVARTPISTLATGGGTGIDYNCDGIVQCFSDQDGDGFGGTEEDFDTQRAGFVPNEINGSGLVNPCTDPQNNFAINGDDCHDTRADANPAVTSDPPGNASDGFAYDEDCDGFVECYRDADRDTWGSYLVTLEASRNITSDAQGRIAKALDTSTPDPDDRTDYYLCDNPGQTWSGTGGVPTSANATGEFDCNDDEDTVFPGATDVVGSDFDDDCDGQVRCWVDADGDGFGTAQVRTIDVDWSQVLSGNASQIITTAGYTAVWTPDTNLAGDVYGRFDCDANGTDLARVGGGVYGSPTFDCHDTNPDARPGGVDNPGDAADGTTFAADGHSWDGDCDGRIECYRDADTDTWGTYIVELTRSATVTSDATRQIAKATNQDWYECDNPLQGWAGRGTVSGNGDCHDDNPQVFPGAGAEVPGNAYDDDCDGTVSCYQDLDNDNYGTAVVPGLPPSAFELVSSPLYDASSPRDGKTQIEAGLRLFMCGPEADLYGTQTLTATPSQLAFMASDEIADKGGTRVDLQTYDCHDDNPNARPGLVEVPGGELEPTFGFVVAFDEDCNGSYDCWVDQDDDGFGIAVQSISRDHVPYRASINSTQDDGVYTCDLTPVQTGAPAFGQWDDPSRTDERNMADKGGRVAGDPNWDCHDTNPVANPDGVEEPGDSTNPLSGSSQFSWDEDCDGIVTCYRDWDDDGRGTYELDLDATDIPNGAGFPASITETIGRVAGQDYYNCDQLNRKWSGSGGGAHGDPTFDCHDDNPNVYFGATAEVPGDPWDNDCNGTVLCYEDRDDDGYGTSETDISIVGAAGVAALSYDTNGETRPMLEAGLKLYPCGVRSLTVDAGWTQTDLDARAGSLTFDTDQRADRGGANNPDEYDCHDDWPQAFPQPPPWAADPEIPGDPFDNDCNGFVACYRDRDGDGFGSDTTFSVQVRDNNDTGFPNLTPEGTDIAYPFAAFPFAVGKGVLPRWPVRAFSDGDPATLDIEEYRANPVAISRRAGAESDAWFNCQDVERIDPDTLQLVADGAASGGRGTTFYDCHDTTNAVYPGFEVVSGDVSVITPAERARRKLITDPVDNDCDGPVVCLVTDGATDAVLGVFPSTIGDCCGNPTLRDGDGNLICPNAAVGAGDWTCFEPLPFATDNGEVPGDPYDNDCDGLVFCYENLDNDFVGSVATLDDDSTPRDLTFDEGLYSCTNDSEATKGGDCHDRNPQVYPPTALITAAADGDVVLGTTAQLTALWGTMPDASGWDDDSCAGAVLCFDDTTDRLLDRYDADAATCATVGVFKCFPETIGDEFDQNCDGAVACYYDQDGDGYGVDSVIRASGNRADRLQPLLTTGDKSRYDCDLDNLTTTPPRGRAPRQEDGGDLVFDCNDTSALESPNGIESYDILGVTPPAGVSKLVARQRAFAAVGNTIDENCDGAVLCWADTDNDGFGAGRNGNDFGVFDDTATDADLPTRWTPASPWLTWDIVDSPNGNDCANPGLTSGDPAQLTGVSSRILDCHDDNDDAYPAAPSVPGDTYDNNCDSVWLCYTDVDGDGWGAIAERGPQGQQIGPAPTIPDQDDDQACNSRPTTPGAFLPEANDALDCLDDNAFAGGAVYPIDPASGAYDESLSTPVAVLTHPRPRPGVASDPSPQPVEVFGDGIDGDCDGFDRCFVDADGDGFPNGDSAGEDVDVLGRTGDVESVANFAPGLTDCNQGIYSEWPLDAVAVGLIGGLANPFLQDPTDFDNSLAIFDCDDTNPNIKPQDIGADQPYNGIDENCDNRSDFDQDLDGYDDAAAVAAFNDGAGRPTCPNFDRVGTSTRRFQIDPVIGCGPGTDTEDSTSVQIAPDIHPAPYPRTDLADFDGNGVIDPDEDIEKAALEAICAGAWDASTSTFDLDLCYCSIAGDPRCPCPADSPLEICSDARDLRYSRTGLPVGFTNPIESYTVLPSDGVANFVAGTTLRGLRGVAEECETQGSAQIDDDSDGNPNTTHDCWFDIEAYVDDLQAFAERQYQDFQRPWRLPSRQLYTRCLRPLYRPGNYYIDRSDPLDALPAALNDPTTGPALVAQLAAEHADDWGGFVWDPAWQRPANAISGRYYRDLDGDGEGDENHQGVVLCDLQAEFDLGNRWDRSKTDCDDSNETINARGIEACDGEDNNCNRIIDEPTEALTDEIDTTCTWHYRDQDGDSWGDRNAELNPAAQERFCICPNYERNDLGQVPRVCEHYNADGELDYGHRLQGSCFVMNDDDCDDLDSNIKPFPPGETEVYELIDGIDNDCNDELPLIEIDCDQDSAYPFLPRMTAALLDNPSEVPVKSAAEVGLAPCCTLDERSGVCRQGAPPQVQCFESERLPLRCDRQTGFWVVPVSALGEERFENAKRVGQSGRCIQDWDCDDRCPQRCLADTETCDGIDNDCNGYREEVLSSLDSDRLLVPADLDGVPDAMQKESLPAPGLVNPSELDLDLDVAMTCSFGSNIGAAGQVAVTTRACSQLEVDADVVDCNDLCYLTVPGQEDACNGFLLADDCSSNRTARQTDNDNDRFLTCGSYGEAPDADEKVYALVLTTGDVDAVNDGLAEFVDIVPLLPPRLYDDEAWVGTTIHNTVRECDQPLDDAIAAYTGNLSVNADDRREQMLSVCILAHTCQILEAQNAESSGQEQANEHEPIPRPDGQSPAPPKTKALPLPSYCDSLLETQCSVVELNLSAEADAQLYDRKVDDDGNELGALWPLQNGCVYDEVGASLFHPEQAIMRTVWSREQIVEARKLVVEFECFRKFGTFGCANDAFDRELEDLGERWVSPYSGLEPRPEGFFPLPNVPADALSCASSWQPDELADPSLTRCEVTERWWLYLDRFSPVTIEGDRSLVGCWGDPRDVGGDVNEVEAIDYVGGDCTQAADDKGRFDPANANRGNTEGPGDLVGRYRGALADCATCLDGVDNNCNALIDAEDPACAQCFVGQGYGCGCSATDSSGNVGRTVTPWLVMWALLAAFARRREERT